MAITSFINYADCQNGSHEVTIIPDGSPHSQGEVVRFLPPPPEPAPAVPAWTPPQLSPPSGPTTPQPQSVIPASKCSGTTLRDLVEKFRQGSGHLAKATREKFDCHFTVAGRYLSFDRDVTGIKLADLRQLKSKLSEGRKPSSVNDILFKALASLFKIAIEDEIIDRSPLERLARSRKGEPDRRQPTWDQSQQIVERVQESSPETGLILAMMRNFGVGQAEIRFLLGEHIDVPAGVIHFRRKKTGKPFDVPIFTHAEALVDQLQQAGRLGVGKAVVEWRNPRKALATACERLNLPTFEPRALRRTFIIYCLEQGMDSRLVAKWQGHKDAKLIFSTYGKHIDREYELAQAKLLGEQTTSHQS